MTTRKSILKAVILGDAGVGKTCLLKQYVNKEFSLQYKATIGADFLSKALTVDNTIVNFQIWDTAGQEKNNSLTGHFYRNSNCCMLVFDLTDPQSLDNVEVWRTSFLKTLEPKDPDTYPFVLLGNKCDKLENIRISQTKIDMYAQSIGNIPYFQTSAKDNLNVEKAFEEVARLACKRASKEDIIFQPKGVVLDGPTRVQYSNKCCNL